MGLEEKILGRLAGLRPVAGRRAGVAAARSRGCVAELPCGWERLASLIGAETGVNKFGEHLVLRRWWEEPSSFETSLETVRLIAPGAPDSAADLRNWLFLDTETTGLSGGTGTYPFLVGLAWWDGGGLQVEQFFMRDHSEEHSVLLALKEQLAERPVLVTFNGKSFDWPLLDTRYRMTRSISAQAPLAHLDLLHPARHLWRLRLGSVRLAELEWHVLGKRREADVISELIPQIYFNYLSGGAPDPLVPVFLHNQMDLVGLAALAARMFSLLAGPEAAGADAFEFFGMSRILERRGEGSRARGLYARAIAGELPRAAGRAARLALARLAKRQGDFELATSLWMELRGALPDGILAYEELAKYYEHRAGEPRRAAELMGEALAELRRARGARFLKPSQYAKAREKFGHRLARLRGKVGGDAGAPLLEAIGGESCGLVAESK
jgi:uncharacterized protein YprB with RNaseH-like and TPR domain